jgi:Domain of unknown function (DUF5615)
MKFLIDECLSPKLAKLARDRGYGESSHVVWLGKGGWHDWNLMPLIIEEDWTFVTNNSIDFRGPQDAAAAGGHYANIGIHAGLICLNGPEGMDLDLQLELFEHALEELARDGDLINQRLEITATEDGEVEVLRYAYPPTPAAEE